MEEKDKSQVYVKRRGNALRINAYGVTHSAPISQILRIIKGKLPFYYVPTLEYYKRKKKEEKAKEIEKGILV